ncbi:MAG: Holliday junction resolvase RuvX [Myxococcaceae bacterium]
MRTMGLDVGSKTIGVAISDELGLTAQALSTVRRSNLKTDLAELKAIASEHEVDRVVVGLPLNMDGSEGPRAAESRKLGASVEKALGLPVEYWDERLSTVAAERILIEADLSRKKRKGVIDQLAAGIILQGWLDARRPLADYDPEP